MGQIPPAFHTHPLVPVQPAAPGLPEARGSHLSQAEIAAVAGEGGAGEGGKWEEKRVVGRQDRGYGGFLKDWGVKRCGFGGGEKGNGSGGCRGAMNLGGAEGS